MSAASATVCVAPLDEPCPVALDPSIWSNNLAALRAVDHEYASALAEVAIPEFARAVRAIDDSISWRLEASGQAPRWLCDTPTPRARAMGLLADHRDSGQNYALGSIGTGQEASLALLATARYVAAFVFETELVFVALALRIHDFSEAIRNRRLNLISPAGPVAHIARLLRENEGLLPPTQIVLPATMSPARIAALREQLAAGTQEVLREREGRSAALIEAPTTAASEMPRLAVLSLSPNVANDAIAFEIAAEARAMGWQILLRRAETPAEAHVNAQLGAIRAFAPTMTICVNHSYSLPALPGGALFALVTDERAAAALKNRPRSQRILATSPFIAAEARKMMGADEPIELVPFGVLGEDGEADDLLSPSTISGDSLRERILYFADLPDERPAATGITQPTHRLVWNAILANLERAGHTEFDAAQIVRRAERAAGMEIHDRETREQIERAVDDVLHPFVERRKVLSALTQTVASVAVIGTGWTRELEQRRDVVHAANSVYELRAIWAEMRPTAAVVTRPEGVFSAECLIAAGCEWPLIVVGAGSLGAGKSPLSPNEHYRAAGNIAELRNATAAAFGKSADVEQMTASARRHVQTCERWRDRLRLLIETENRR